MKKQLIITTYDSITNPYYRGGGAQAIHEIAKRLIGKYDVMILTAYHQGARNQMIDQVKYQYIGIDLHPKLNQILFQLALIKYIRQITQGIIIENFTPPTSISLMPIYAHVPVIGLAHMFAGYEMRQKYKLPFEYIEQYGLRYYKCIIVLSTYWKSYVQYHSPRSQIYVIPNGITHTYKAKPSKNYVLYLGRVELEQKGLALLLKMWQTHPNLPDLQIVGDGLSSEKQKLAHLIKRYQLQDRVVVSAYATGKTKNNLIAHATCVVIPSRFETFCIVALESIALGVPVVCFDIPGLGWLTKKVARKIKPYDATAFAAAVNNLALNKQARQKLVSNTYQCASNYQWSSIAKSYQNMLKKVV